MLATNDEEVYERAKRLRWMGVDSSTFERTASGKYKWNYRVEELGYKYHMNDISAIIASKQIECLDDQNFARRCRAEDYKNMLSDLWASRGDIQIINREIPDGCLSAHHLFVIRVKNGSRDELHTHLASKGITTGVHYYPNHRYNIFGDAQPIPTADEAFDEILSLPMYWQMTEQEQTYVCKAIKSYFDNL